MAEDLKSNDPICHQKVIDALSVRQNETHPAALRIGERSELASKMNKYWRVESKEAYKRIIREIAKHPEGLDMARSSDESVLREAADLMTPRIYTSRRDKHRWKDNARVSERQNVGMSEDYIAENPSVPYSSSSGSRRDEAIQDPIDVYSWYSDI